MNLRPLGRSKRSTALAITAATATAAALVIGGNLAWAENDGLVTDEYDAGTYIVQVAGEPVASYTGSVSGYEATASDDGERLDPTSSEADRYRDYLPNCAPTYSVKCPEYPPNSNTTPSSTDSPPT